MGDADAAMWNIDSGKLAPDATATAHFASELAREFGDDSIKAVLIDKVFVPLGASRVKRLKKCIKQELRECFKGLALNGERWMGTFKEYLFEDGEDFDDPVRTHDSGLSMPSRSSSTTNIEDGAAVRDNSMTPTAMIGGVDKWQQWMFPRPALKSIVTMCSDGMIDSTELLNTIFKTNLGIFEARHLDGPQKARYVAIMKELTQWSSAAVAEWLTSGFQSRRLGRIKKPYQFNPEDMNDYLITLDNEDKYLQGKITTCAQEARLFEFASGMPAEDRAKACLITDGCTLTPALRAHVAPALRARVNALTFRARFAPRRAPRTAINLKQLPLMTGLSSISLSTPLPAASTLDKFMVSGAHFVGSTASSSSTPFAVPVPIVPLRSSTSAQGVKVETVKNEEATAPPLPSADELLGIDAEEVMPTADETKAVGDAAGDEHHDTEEEEDDDDDDQARAFPAAFHARITPILARTHHPPLRGHVAWPRCL